MYLQEKVKEVLKLFEELDREISKFKEKTGLKCKEGCIKCCLKPDIEATVLEFLPLAWDILLSGEIEYWIDRAKKAISERCILLSDNGCMMYEKRGLICRLFGFSFILDKRSRPSLWACPYLKDKYKLPTSYFLSDIPVASHYSIRLIAIDPYLSNRRYPINEAILRALKLVESYIPYLNLQSLPLYS